ncbi:sensor histidine kinase [Catenuloplanes atrovinosus]|uniref:Two-component system sensor histidine kinase DesK n=1 Tax=Catenuloplanes atrovinosus TaxID=137266 RepID=A0AAE4C8I1_9ACTN|nr:histidine kinase [Catenuloplanes atrovinosus]MDR7274647.1 two-component system sensor histidine kinase DesK [Catenuloplanes atrovinosus]
MNPLAWWHARSQAERFDISFRTSFYVALLALPLLFSGAVSADGDARAAVTFVLVAIGYTALVSLLMHAGIEHYLGRRGRPVRLLVAAGAATVLCAAASIVWFPGGMDAGPVIAGLTCSYLVGAAALRSLWPSLVVTVIGFLTLLVLGIVDDPADTVPHALSLLFGASMLFVGYRSSLWMLAVVWELDRSRTVQASLAVTEERLRIARDMHDVIGRNLSVIALKAELAAQLARRGRDQAVDEMLEVRRIAQDALTDVRAVVGGYRSAGLGDELAGARALLASAGIECRVIGEGRDLPESNQATLGWVVREGVTNVLRHSDARCCTITLRADAPDTVTLTMDNDGTRTTGRVRFGGGLLGLTERVGALGGALTADGETPGRFRLTATVPRG